MSTKSGSSDRTERLLDLAVSASLSFGLFILCVIVWQMITALGLLPAYLVPTPAATAHAIWRDMTDPHFWSGQFLQTLYVVVVGFLIAAVMGILIGPLLIVHPLVERSVYPFVVAFQAMPKIAMAPLILVWFGYGHTSKFMITALVAFFPVVVNVIAGLKAGDERQLILMRALRANWWTRLVRVRIPNAMPYIFAGLDVAAVFAVIGAVVAEFLGSPNGLGSLVIIRQTNFDTPGLFSVLFFLAAMGSALHFLINAMGRKFAFWSQSSDSKTAQR
ncbi:MULTISPECIES: ABC transporter permease [Rhodopseudomonas]|nr:MULTISPECIES: ABC transporter permease [Rhodopseudomonas]MDF3811019.1 ABC transporter permease [Rhodopseudomonas sp. BAL398]WOK15917.1 ABC transporter permease [Rhodopseudomonas sp. BAL398]